MKMKCVKQEMNRPLYLQLVLCSQPILDSQFAKEYRMRELF